MTKNPYATQVLIYRRVSERLLVAIATRSTTRAAHEAARDAHDDRRRNLMLDGIPGIPERCPADIREAGLLRALEPETAAIRATRERLRAADAEWESACVQERAERETLRASYMAHAQ